MTLGPYYSLHRDKLIGDTWCLLQVPRRGVFEGPSAPSKRHVALLQGGQAKSSAAAPEVMVVTGASAVAFVALASAMLLLLFFFMNHVFALVLVSPVQYLHAAFDVP